MRILMFMYTVQEYINCLCTLQMRILMFMYTLHEQINCLCTLYRNMLTFRVHWTGKY